MNSSIDVRRPRAVAVSPGARRALPAAAVSAVMLAAALAAAPAQADSVTRVYKSRMQDGSVVFGDKPAQGAVQSTAREYSLPKPPSAAELEAERTSWVVKEREFDRRHMERQAIQAARARQERFERMLAAAIGTWATPGMQEGFVYGTSYYQPILTPSPQVGGSTYRTSPGAVNGRGAPFLTSGFQAHPVRPW